MPLEGIDWLVSVHCVSHQFELSIADVLKSTLFSDVDEMLVKIYHLYKNSPKQLRQLAELGEALEMAVSAPVIANGTRWMEHKLRALNWISKNYGLLMAHLSNLTEDTTYPSAEWEKFKGMHLKYRNAKYPLYVEYFIEVLTPAAELSLHFQREEIDVVDAARGIKSFFRIMGKLKESSALYIFSTGRVKKFFDVASSESADDDGEDDDHRQCTMYQEVKLTHVDQAKSSLSNVNNDILSHILQCFTRRFEKTNNLFNALVKVLDTKVYPEVGVDDAYGQDEVSLLVEWFHVLLTANGCDVEKIEREWDDVKEMVVTTGLKGTNYIDVWAKLFTSSKKEALRNILHLVEILLVVSVSNALLEQW